MTNDTKAPDLLPCPFCGGSAEHSVGKTGDGKPWHYVECVECGALGPNAPYADHNIDVLSCCAEQWNIRADHALSLVAAAYEDAADTIRRAYTSSDGWIHPSNQGDIEDILARTNADAQAALEARDQRIRDEVASVADQLGWHCIGCGHICGDPEKDLQILKRARAWSCCPEREMEPLSKAIFALIEKDKTDE